MTELVTLACAECGRMMVRDTAVKSYPLCAACVTAPGWFKDPALALWLAPHAPEQPRHSTAPATRAKFGLTAGLAAVLWVGVLAWTMLQIFGGAR